MIPSTKENKTITKNQFYQLLGLCLASVKFEEKRIALCDAWAEIVGENNRGRFWDFYELSDISEKILKEKLGYDKISIKKSGK